MQTPPDSQTILAASRGITTATPPAQKGILDQLVRPQDLVFDVGANIGGKAEHFLSRGGRVVCIEPQPHCAENLRRKFKDNPNVAIVDQGLAEKPGTLELLICDSADTLSTFADHWTKGRFSSYSWNKKIPVGVTTLDQMIQTFGCPRYCKIDVEGFEYQVLRGLSRPVPFISFEFTTEFVDNARLCVSHLMNLGYRKFNIAVGESSHFAFGEWVSPELVFALIRKSNDPTLWGDLYAWYDEPASTALTHSSLLDTFQEQKLWNPGTPLKLHLGCGETKFSDYINIDYPVSEHAVMKVTPDYCTDITAMTLPNESVDEVRLHHVFEHFSRVTALAMLIKWQMWLKRGGVLHLETPDLVGCAQVLLSPSSPWSTKMGIVRHLAGDQTAAWAYHVDHWFPERYERTLSKLGFTDIQIQTWNWEKPPYLANVVVKARKGINFSLDQLLKIADELLLESLVAPEETWNQDVWTVQLRQVLAGKGVSKAGNVTDAPITPQK